SRAAARAQRGGRPGLADEGARFARSEARCEACCEPYAKRRNVCVFRFDNRRAKSYRCSQVRYGLYLTTRVLAWAKGSLHFVACVRLRASQTPKRRKCNEQRDWSHHRHDRQAVSRSCAAESRPPGIRV